MDRRFDRREFLAAAGGAASVALAGCVGVLSQDDYDVGMTADAFTPDRLVVDAGTTVVWENTSTRAHTVTAYEDLVPEDADYFATGGFDSEAAAREAWEDGGRGGIDNGEQFSHTFEIPGEYGYVCVPHEQAGMIGTIVVEE